MSDNSRVYFDLCEILDFLRDKYPDLNIPSSTHFKHHPEYKCELKTKGDLFDFVLEFPVESSS